MPWKRTMRCTISDRESLKMAVTGWPTDKKRRAPISGLCRRGARCRRSWISRSPQDRGSGVASCVIAVEKVHRLPSRQAMDNPGREDEARQRSDERNQLGLAHAASRDPSRSSRFITVDTCQRPPRRVRMPRAFGSAAITRRLRFRFARLSANSGARSRAWSPTRWPRVSPRCPALFDPSQASTPALGGMNPAVSGSGPSTHRQNQHQCQSRYAGSLSVGGGTVVARRRAPDCPCRP